MTLTDSRQGRGGIPQVLVLTGTCGSGKSTIAARLGARPGWAHLSEDDVWRDQVGLNRGPFGSREYTLQRERVQAVVFASIRGVIDRARNVALDATVHEAPPASYGAYRGYFEAHQISWALRILHPTLEVAVARDAARSRRPIGVERIAALRAKFDGSAFAPEWFVDTSRDSPEETVARLVAMGVA